MRERTRELEQANTHLANINTQLRESEQRFRDLADLLPLAVCETDTTGTITYANRKAHESYGYTKEELKGGLSIFNMVTPQDREDAMVNAGKVAQGGEERTTGTEYIRRYARTVASSLC